MYTQLAATKSSKQCYFFTCAWFVNIFAKCSQVQQSTENLMFSVKVHFSKTLISTSFENYNIFLRQLKQMSNQEYTSIASVPNATHIFQVQDLFFYFFPEEETTSTSHKIDLIK